MKKLILMMSLIAQVGSAAKFDCKNQTGATLKLETKEQMINAKWYSYKKNKLGYTKVPVLMAHFQGAYASKIDPNTVFYYAKDLLSDLYASIELEKYMTTLKQKAKKCHRGGCDTFPIPFTQYKATLHLSNTRFPHSFICTKLN